MGFFLVLVSSLASFHFNSFRFVSSIRCGRESFICLWFSSDLEMDYGRWTAQRAVGAQQLWVCVCVCLFVSVLYRGTKGRLLTTYCKAQLCFFNGLVDSGDRIGTEGGDAHGGVFFFFCSTLSCFLLFVFTKMEFTFHSGTCDSRKKKKKK